MDSMMDEPTVFVVDDDQANRDLLRHLMDSVDLAVETFCSAREFLDAFQPDRRGCLLLDVRMPGMSGLELQKELAARGIDLPVIIVTGHSDVQMAVTAMKRGAFDFIEKPINNQQLLDLVHKAMKLDASLAEEMSRKAEFDKRLSLLTPRERQILDLIAAGKANKQIAHDLGISQRTVEVHRAKVMKKIQAKSLADLMKMVIG